MVTDPAGRRTGEDPRGVSNPMQGTELNEIPGAVYSTNSVGDSPLPDYEASPEDLSFDFEYGIKTPDNDGLYFIETIGIESAEYSLFVDITPERGSSLQGFRAAIKALTDSNQTNTFQLLYNGEHGSPIKFEKVVKSQTIRQDLDNSFKLKLLNDAQLYNNLRNLLTAFEQYLAKADSISARQELVLFQQTLDGKSKDTTNVTTIPQGMMSVDAWKILHDDAQSFFISSRYHARAR